MFESRDTTYEPGRRVELLAPVAGTSWVAKTITNPRRPRTVGNQTMLSGRTLRTKWRRVEEAT